MGDNSAERIFIENVVVPDLISSKIHLIIFFKQHQSLNESKA